MSSHGQIQTSAGGQATEGERIPHRDFVPFIISARQDKNCWKAGFKPNLNKMCFALGGYGKPEKIFLHTNIKRNSRLEKMRIQVAEKNKLLSFN